MANTLAEAVLKQNDKLDRIRDDGIRDRTTLDDFAKDLQEITSHGSPITDRRLTVLEYKLGIK